MRELFVRSSRNLRFGEIVGSTLTRRGVKDGTSQVSESRPLHPTDQDPSGGGVDRGKPSLVVVMTRRRQWVLQRFRRFYRWLRPCRLSEGRSGRGPSPCSRHSRSHLQSLLSHRCWRRPRKWHGAASWRAEDQVDDSGCPLDLASFAIASFQHAFVLLRFIPLRIHVEQVYEEVVGQSFGAFGEDAMLRVA